MLATAVMAGFGFLFWIITSHLYSTADIGLATALISVMNFIIYFSLIGFNVAFIRFLPTSTHANDKINTGVTLVGIVAFMLSSGFVVLVHLLSPRLAFIETDPTEAILFVVASVSAALSILTESIFLAYRRTFFTLASNTAGSLLKMLLPFFFVGFGAIGIFAAAAAAQIAGLLINVAILVRTFNYKPRFFIGRDILKEVWGYATGNYVASVFTLLPPAVLPILIVNHLGAQPAAYFYIVMMIANLLYVIPNATTRSLFAEGSTDEKSIALNIRKTFGFTAALLLPAIAILLIGAYPILSIFGKGYADGGAGFLRIIAITSIFVGVSSLLSALFQIRRNVRGTIITNLCYATTVLGIAYLLIENGLTAVGFALLAGSVVSNAIGFLLYTRISNIVAVLDESFYFGFVVRLRSKIAYYLARTRQRGKPFTVLFYPERPKPMHLAYQMCHYLGYKISSNPRAPFDAVVAFSDVTVRAPSELLEKIMEKHTVANGGAADISKSHVDEIVRKVFGYGTGIDPQSFNGPCVRKSESNALHDGRVLICPTDPEPGYFYQKLIDNQHGTDQVADIRVMVFGDTIACGFNRYRSLHDRFDNTQSVVMRNLDDILSADEQRDVLRFCKEFGVDCADLDILRDNKDGRIYIVDVNPTPSVPRPGTHLETEMFQTFIQATSRAFAAMLRHQSPSGRAPEPPPHTLFQFRQHGARSHTQATPLAHRR